VYFSTRRSLPIQASRTKKKLLKGIALSYSDALKHRELNIQEFIDWWVALEMLVHEGVSDAANRLSTQQKTLTLFLENCSNLHTVRTPKPTLLLNKSGVAIDVLQLSDGERGILALVLDLARRLSITNPQLEDPLQGQAVVLIDELDLHLHPKWQRTIVQKLTTTFPNCQFIATTHSPLIVGEVPPENIILLEDSQPPFRPDQSLGMDTDWILKYLMGATTRNHKTENTLKHIANLIETEDYDEALDAIDTLRDEIGEFPELVRLQTRIDRLQLLGE
jgi:hypothetical protein